MFFSWDEIPPFLPKRFFPSCSFQLPLFGTASPAGRLPDLLTGASPMVWESSKPIQFGPGILKDEVKRLHLAEFF